MGVEMRVLLLPSRNSFRPSAASLAGLIDRLRADGWVVDPAAPWLSTMRFVNGTRAAARTGAYAEGPRWRGQVSLPAGDLSGWLTTAGGSFLKFTWPVESLRPPVALRYPLDTASPVDPEDTYYDLELWLSDRFLEPISELIDPIDSTCPCGQSLAASEDGSDSLFCSGSLLLRCPACGAGFDPAARPAQVRDPWTGQARTMAGGAVLRFALVVDLGKCWPPGSGWGVHPELRQLCEEHFGLPFQEIRDVY